MDDDDDDDWETAEVDLKTDDKAFEEEDEEVDLSEIEQKAPPPQPKKETSENEHTKLKASKAKAKAKERERLLQEEAERAKNAKPLTAEEKEAERLRLRRLVEESDHKLTEDLFGTSSGVDDKEESEETEVLQSQKTPAVASQSSTVELKATNSDAVMTHLSRVQLKTMKDFTAFAGVVGKRLSLVEKPNFTREFIKELIRATAPEMDDNDLTQIDQVLSVVKNEKVKQVLNKKKKKKGKASVKVSRNDYDDLEAEIGKGNIDPRDYDDDGLDFM